MLPLGDLKRQYNRKFTSTFTITATACPSLSAGLNFQLRTASRAFSSSPMPSARIPRKIPLRRCDQLLLIRFESQCPQARSLLLRQ
jgi:hypothetical protein